MPAEKKAVLTAEAKRVHDYDLVFIITPELPEEAVEAAVNNITQFITGKGGTIVNTEKWGKKKLAYPLKHFLEGYYVFIKFKMETTWSKELDNNLNISENILRHLLIKAGD